MAYLYKFVFPGRKKMPDIIRIEINTFPFTVFPFFYKLAEWVHVHTQGNVSGLEDVSAVVVEAD